MSPEERRRRARQMSAEAINEAVIATMVSEAFSLDGEQQSRYCRVCSFEDEDLHYESIVDEEDKMKSCNCADFQFNHIAYKHMYLLKRVHNDMFVFEHKCCKEN